MLIAKRVGNSFDILNYPDETSASISRTKDQIQISFINPSLQLERYKKLQSSQTLNGSYLSSYAGIFRPTGDKHKAKAVLLTDFTTDAKTKEVTINNKTYTARLLPVVML